MRRHGKLLFNPFQQLNCPALHRCPPVPDTLRLPLGAHVCSFFVQDRLAECRSICLHLPRRFASWVVAEGVRVAKRRASNGSLPYTTRKVRAGSLLRVHDIKSKGCNWQNQEKGAALRDGHDSTALRTLGRQKTILATPRAGGAAKAAPPRMTARIRARHASA